MNFFSNHLFSQALQRAYFPGQDLRQTVFKLQGQYWQVPATLSHEPVSDLWLPSQFIDFYEPLTGGAVAVIEKEQQEIPQLGYLPRVCHGLAGAEVWQQNQLVEQYEPAPTVKWDASDSWEDFKAQRKRIFKNTERCRRKLEREVGQPVFTFHDERGDVLPTAMAWKSKQYLATGEPDAFANSAHVSLLKRLAAANLLQLSSLRVGKQLLAVYVGFIHQNRYCAWVAAYDCNYHNYAPGRQLLHYMLQESFERGHQEFDFLRGNEAYKWKYATHTRLIGELGRPDLSIRAKRQVKAALRVSLLEVFNSVPQAKSFAKTVALRI